MKRRQISAVDSGYQLLMIKLLNQQKMCFVYQGESQNFSQRHFYVGWVTMCHIRHQPTGTIANGYRLFIVILIYITKKI